MGVIYFDFITLRNGILNISGYLESETGNLGVFALVNGVKTEPDSYEYPTRCEESIFNFDFKIPVHENDLEIDIQSNDCVKYPFKFRQFCNLSEYSNYYIKDNKIVYYSDNLFKVVKYSYFKFIKFEINGLFKILKTRPAFFAQAIFFRLLYLVLYPVFKNREIWIIMDRKTLADDNAEFFFKYALSQDDGIKKFFSINRSSPDYERLTKEYDNILAFESVKHRFYYTFAKKVISSQGSEFYLNPFKNRNYYQTAGISNVDFYFLQHGIIKDNMSSWLRKYDRNPNLIVTSTQLEYESLFDEGYFYDRDVIQMLGLPRYDNLNNKGLKKQIVIMPSWRNYLTNSEEVYNSEYFKRFNSLINNEKLIDYASKKGYEIVLKPHPELLDYIDLFDKNDYVTIDFYKKYQELFNESSLLITDYSSIFFDFSYLKKPIIYYQYGNDYHYDAENGYFKYKSMGFGPVVESEEKLIETIIHYIDSDCVMEDIYKKRVDDFFKYHDNKNSKRCYDWILNH